MPPKPQLLTAIILLLCGAALVTFWPTSEAEFLEWDDDHNVYHNAHLESLNADNLRWMFFDVGRDTRYKALSWLVWAGLRQAFGLHAPAFHAANLALHTVNVVLLFAVLLRLLALAGVTDDEHRLWPASGAALFWALHPLRVEPVAWVTGLPYHLSLLFLLLALIAYLHLDFRRPAFRQPRYWWTLLGMSGAMLSYPMPAGAFVFFLSLNIFPLRRLRLSGVNLLTDRGNLRVGLELLPLLLICMGLLGASIYGAHVQQGIHAPPPDLAQFPLVKRVAQAGYILFYYLWKPLLPTDLSPVYQTFSNFDPASPAFVLSGTVVVILTFLAWRRRSDRPGFTAFWLAHLGVLAPVLGVDVLGHVAADRYAIIHGTLISAALALFLARPFSEQNRVALLTALATAMLLFAVQSRRLCHHWHDNVSFFTFQLASLPPGGAKAQAHFRLGSELARRGDHANAVIQYQAAKAAYPAANIATLPYRHAESLYALGRFAEAADRYREAAALCPEAYEIWYGFALSLVRLGQLHEAADICRMAAARHPEVPEFREELERIKARLSR